MSSTIWTRSGGRANLAPLRSRPFRVVEAQHAFATRKLVDSAAEQALLERLIESAKPPRLPEAEGLHELLSTPFRYPPLPRGSRFGGRFERGLWYGSERVETALAEKAYYVLLLLAGTTAPIRCLEKDYSSFRALVRTDRGVDLLAGPFLAHRDALRSPTSYAATQALGQAMRADGVEAFRYPSARDSAGRPNVGVIAPAAFGRRAPSGAPESWHCTATAAQVGFRRRVGFVAAREVRFDRESFLVDGELPHPGV